MFRTIHTYNDGIKSQGHFLICILFLNKRETQGDSPVSSFGSWTGNWTWERATSSHKFTQIRLMLHLKTLWCLIWNGSYVFIGEIPGIDKTWCLINLKLVASAGKNRTGSVFVFAVQVINSLFFLQVHNRKQFSTCSWFRSFLFPWIQYAGRSSFVPSMSKTDWRPHQLLTTRSNNPPRWHSLHSMLLRNQELA